VGSPAIMSRTKGADLEAKTIHELLDKHVALGRCTPEDLWRLRSITTAGLTSDWQAIKGALPLLSDIIDETGGRGINQCRFAKQLDAWLKHHSMHWKFIDTETCAKRLRAMFSTLLAVRREQKTVPRSFAMIEAVAVKLVLEASPTKNPRDDIGDASDDEDADQSDLGPKVEDNGDTDHDDLDKCASALFSKQSQATTSAAKQPRLELPRKASTFTLFDITAAGSDEYAKIQSMLKAEPLIPPTKEEYDQLGRAKKRNGKVGPFKGL
jgi:hypothetical protein